MASDEQAAHAPAASPALTDILLQRPLEQDLGRSPAHLLCHLLYHRVNEQRTDLNRGPWNRTSVSAGNMEHRYWEGTEESEAIAAYQLTFAA